MLPAWNKYTTEIICQHVNCNHVRAKEISYCNCMFHFLGVV